MTKAQYFFLRCSTSTKEVGRIRQVEDLTISWDRNMLGKYQWIYDQFPDEISDYTVLRLHDRAKITDVVSTIFLSFTQGLIVNEKVKNILEKHNEGNFRFYDAMVTDKNKKTYPYYVFCVNRTPEIIDFAASKFKLEKNVISVLSYNDFKNKKDEHGYFECSKIAFKKKWDIIRIPTDYVDASILISEDLKNELVAAKVTGVDYVAPTPTGIKFCIV